MTATHTLHCNRGEPCICQAQTVPYRANHLHACQITISDRHSIGLPGADQESPSRPLSKGDSGAHYSGLFHQTVRDRRRFAGSKLIQNSTTCRTRAGDDFGIWLSHEVAGKVMVEDIDWGKAMSSPTVIDGDLLLKDMFSRDAHHHTGRLRRPSGTDQRCVAVQMLRQVLRNSRRI